MYESKMLTKGEHDDLWRKGAKSNYTLDERLSDIDGALRCQNALTIVKELYTLGDLTKEAYITILDTLLKKSGFEFVAVEEA